MTTRATSKTIFSDILTDILGQSKDSDIHKALLANYISTLQDLMNMSDEDITLLDFQNSDGKVLALHQSHQALLSAFQDFVRYTVSKYITNYTLVTSDDFDTYCIGVYNLHASIPATKVITVPLDTTTSAISTQVLNSETMLTHVMTNILDLHEDMENSKVFKHHQITSLEDVLSIPETDIRFLSYIDNDVVVLLHRTHRNCVHNLQSLIHYNCDQGMDEFPHLTIEDFDEYRLTYNSSATLPVSSSFSCEHVSLNKTSPPAKKVWFGY